MHILRELEAFLIQYLTKINDPSKKEPAGSFYVILLRFPALSQTNKGAKAPHAGVEVGEVHRPIVAL